MNKKTHRKARVKNVFQMDCSEVLNMSTTEAMTHVDIRDELKTQFSTQDAEDMLYSYKLRMIDLRKMDKIYLQTRFIPHFKFISEQYDRLKNNTDRGFSNSSFIAHDSDQSCEYMSQNPMERSPRVVNPLNFSVKSPKINGQTPSEPNTIVKFDKLATKSSEVYDEYKFDVVFGDSVQTGNQESCFYHAYKTSDVPVLNKINQCLENKFNSKSLVPCLPEQNSKVIIHLNNRWYRSSIYPSNIPDFVLFKLVDIGRYLEVNRNVIFCYKVPEDAKIYSQRPLSFPIKIDRDIKVGTIAKVEQVNSNLPVEAIVLHELGTEDSGLTLESKPLQNGQSPPEGVKSSVSLVTCMQKLKLKENEDFSYKDKAISSGLEINKTLTVNIVDKTEDYLIVTLDSGPRNMDLVNGNDVNINYDDINENDYVLVFDTNTSCWHRGLLLNKKDCTFYLIDMGKNITSKRCKRLLSNMLDMPVVYRVQMNASLLKFCQIESTIEILPLYHSDKITTVAQLLLAPWFAIETPHPIPLHENIRAHYAIDDVTDSSVHYFFTRFNQFSSTLVEIHSCIKNSTQLVHVVPGDYCALVQDAGIYCRAKVLEVSEENASVFMLDYGEVDTVDISMCWQLPEEAYAYPPCITKVKCLQPLHHLETKTEVTLVAEKKLTRDVYAVRIFH